MEQSPREKNYNTENYNDKQFFKYAGLNLYTASFGTSDI